MLSTKLRLELTPKSDSRVNNNLEKLTKSEDLMNIVATTAINSIFDLSNFILQVIIRHIIQIKICRIFTIYNKPQGKTLKNRLEICLEKMRHQRQTRENENKYLTREV